MHMITLSLLFNVEAGWMMMMMMMTVEAFLHFHWTRSEALSSSWEGLKVGLTQAEYLNKQILDWEYILKSGI